MRTLASGMATNLLLWLMVTPELWVPWPPKAESFKALIAIGVLAKCIPAAFARFGLGDGEGPPSER